MEHDICMICSNALTAEENLFHPCECNFKYCFYCFKDIFEKLSGSRQGKCPQCTKPLKARIQVPSNLPPRLPTDKHQLKNIRIVSRESLYIKQIPCSLSVELLQSSQYFGKYGEIKNISIDLKYFPEDPPETYRLFLHYFNKQAAVKALLGVNNFEINRVRIIAEYVLLNFCGNFLKNKKCFNKGCKFLHEVSDDLEWVWVRDIEKIDLSGPKNVEKFEKVESSGFPDVKVVYCQEIVMPKRSSKYVPKYIPVSAIKFKNSEQERESERKERSLQEIKENVVGKTTKGGVFAILGEED